MYSWAKLHQGTREHDLITPDALFKVKWYCEIYEKTSEDSSAFDVILNTFASIPNCSFSKKKQPLYMDTKILRKEFFTSMWPLFMKTWKYVPVDVKKWQYVCNRWILTAWAYVCDTIQDIQSIIDGIHKRCYSKRQCLKTPNVNIHWNTVNLSIDCIFWLLHVSKSQSQIQSEAILNYLQWCKC